MKTPAAILVMFDEDGPGRQYRLEDQALLGRDSECQVEIVDASVSKRHARITHDRAAGGYLIEDLGSLNGVFVNGRKVTSPESLCPNDVIRIGDRTLFFDPDFTLLPDGRGERMVLLQNDPAAGPGPAKFARSRGSSLPEDLRDELLLALGQKRPFAAAFRALGRRVPFDAAAVLSVREGKLSEPAWIQAAGRTVRISRSLAEQALSQRGGILVEDAATDPACRLSPSVARGKLRSVMAAALELSGEVRAVAFLSNDQPGAFREPHLDLLLSASPILAAATRRKEKKGGPASASPEDIVGASRATAGLKGQIARAAATDAAVLVLGETGSGKELVARWLHAMGRTPQGPFVAVNCGAIPETLAENELFGHERGAFTGADRIQPGKLELAVGGTLFLDEIGDLPWPLQKTLLRVLADGDFYRIGGKASMKAKFRLVAATHRDLQALCKEGKFREDLYFRLNVVRIEVPPLRDRPEDVRPLAERFVERFARELNRQVLGIDPRALELLQAYRWPGNVRELRNAVERMVVQATSPVLGPALLPAEIAAPPSGGPGSLNLDARTFALEGDLLKQAMVATGEHKSAAARLLGIPRTRLNRLLARHGITAAVDDR